MPVELISNVTIYQRLLSCEDCPNCGYVGKFGCTQPSGEPNHGTMPEEIIATNEIMIPPQMVLPCLMTRHLVQVSGYGIDTNIEGACLGSHHIKTSSRSKFAGSIILIG